MEIVESFANESIGRVMVVEPNICHVPSHLADLKVSKVEVHEAIQDADILVLLVDHNEFKGMDKNDFMSKIIIDTKGIW